VFWLIEENYFAKDALSFANSLVEQMKQQLCNNLFWPMPGTLFGRMAAGTTILKMHTCLFNAL
jgi:hypothetical protein